MSILGQFSRKLLFKIVQLDLRTQITNNSSVCSRFLSHSPLQYDDTEDPGPIFIKKEVQSLLKTLTRVDLAKVYRRMNLGEKKLEQPEYKFMTEEQLKEALDEAKKKVDVMLQMPPVVPVRRQKNRIIARDPALQGLDTSTFVFTDITFGVRDSDRIILVRDTEGTLKEADWEMRDRMNQLYFPVPQRLVKVPKMFEDEYLEDLLNRNEYVFILDRACLQFEPNNPLYQKTVSITYQHINENNKFDVIRSTRHFGPFAFFLTWHKMIDNLLLDLIESENIDEAKALVDLYGHIHKQKFGKEESPEVVEEYIKNFATKKGALELALQAYRNSVKRKQQLDDGIKRAHGVS